MLKITINRDAVSLGIHIAYAIVEDVTVEEDRADVVEHAKKLARKLREQYTIERLKGHPIIRAYRDFYWRIKIDPTKIRPSSEALLRRVLRTGNIPLINNVVDAGNFASLETLVPIGLYDLDKIKGNLVIKLAKGDEVFEPIGRGPSIIREGTPILVDEEKVVHLYPHRDSARTAITKSTKRVLVISCGVPGVPITLVKEAAQKASRYLELFAQGRITYGVIHVHG